MNLAIKNAFIMPECAECKGCCQSIPESICGYNTLDAVLKKEIAEEIIHQMVIYRVHEGNIDEMGKKWMLYPFVNLLRYITHPDEQAHYEFLALPAVTGRCIFLTPQGCLYPDAKPFECSIYPFYMYKLQFRTDYECRYTRRLEDEIEQHAQLGQFFGDLLLYSNNFQQHYFEDLKRLKKEYNWEIIQI